ncbi:MAG: S24/S26 family peptidase [Acidobacteriota bacterium]
MAESDGGGPLTVPDGVGYPSGVALVTPEVPLLLRGFLEEGTAVTVDVAGSSMTPFIRSGDTLTLCPTLEESARLGDTLAILEPGRPFRVHRVIHRGATLQTRGDAAPESDPPVHGPHVLARVEQVKRGGRRIRLGLGPERAALALLSRWGILHFVVRIHGWFKTGRRGP